MKLRLLFAWLLTSAVQVAMAGVVGVTPVNGESYKLYNLGQRLYLTANSDGTFSLSDEGTEFTIVRSADDGTYQLLSGVGILSTSFGAPAFYPEPGVYNHWSFRKLNASRQIYAMSCLEDETNAFAYVYYSNATSCLDMTSVMTMLANGQWIFTDGELIIDPNIPDDYGEPVVEFHQDATEVGLPEGMPEKVTVRLYRTAMTINKRNVFSVPFKMSAEQIESTFGKGTVVYQYLRSIGSKLYYTPSSKIEAGKPYLVIPTKEHEGDYYEIMKVETSTFCDEPIDVVKGSFAFCPALCRITNLPSDIWTYSEKNQLTHYSNPTDISGFRAYFMAMDGQSKIDGEFVEDEETGITDLNNTVSLVSPVYNIKGQMVSASSEDIDNLAPGVYVVNGKKFIIK